MLLAGPVVEGQHAFVGRRFAVRLMSEMKQRELDLALDSKRRKKIRGSYPSSTGQSLH